MLPYDDPYVGLGLGDNTVIDIVVHKNAVWLATSEGVAYALIGQSLWNRYDKTNGLIANDISALYSSGDYLWVAMNHYEPNADYATADGLAITSDTGRTWDVLTPNGTVGFVNIVYDISGVDSIVYCASWFGGLLATFDNGLTWKNVYFSVTDSVNAALYPNDPSNSNRCFTVVADTLHNDSMIVWVGTADGIRRYVYAPDFAKASSNYIFDLLSAYGYVFVCGDAGLSRLKYDTLASGFYAENFQSAFQRDNLPGPAVLTAFGFANRLFVGTLDSLVYVPTYDGENIIEMEYVRYGESIGLAVSDDSGLTFSTLFSGVDDLIGENRYPVAFDTIGQNLFMAAYEGGLYRSSDSGDTWQKMYVDTLDTTAANRRNVINTIAADSSILWAGTDSGVVMLYVSDSGTIDSSSNFDFSDGAATGGRSYKIGIQHYIDTSLDVIDSTAVWSLNHPHDTSTGTYSLHYTMDSGISWINTYNQTGFPAGRPLYDIAFDDSITYLLGDDLFRSTPNKNIWYGGSGVAVQDSAKLYVSFNGLRMNSILVVQDTLHEDTLGDHDTIYIGSEYGLAVSPGPSLRWHIILTNTNPQHFDYATAYYAPAIYGDFVNAMGLQPLDYGLSRIWASTHPVSTGDTLVDALVSSGLDGFGWADTTYRYEGAPIWNVDFRDAEIYGASSIGLIYSLDTGRTWDTVMNISGTMVTADPPMPFTMDTSKWVTAVRVVGDTLWIGKEDGAAKIALDELGTDSWLIYRAEASEGVYAFPVPYSQSLSGRLYFNYYVPQDANVTIEVYDFAMNLVKTVLDNVPHVQGDGLTYWDGINGRGDRAAVGMYYFKVSFSTGSEEWGKLVIIP